MSLISRVNSTVYPNNNVKIEAKSAAITSNPQNLKKSSLLIHPKHIVSVSSGRYRSEFSEAIENLKLPDKTGLTYDEIINLTAAHKSAARELKNTKENPTYKDREEIKAKLRKVVENYKAASDQGKLDRKDVQDFGEILEQMKSIMGSIEELEAKAKNAESEMNQSASSLYSIGDALKVKYTSPENLGNDVEVRLFHLLDKEHERLNQEQRESSNTTQNDTNTDRPFWKFW